MKIIRITKADWTPEERARHKELREMFKHCPTPEQLLASGDYSGFVLGGQYDELRKAVYHLKQARERAGLSLADVAMLSHIDKAALSRLENGRQLNPTLDTLYRYAMAIGKLITFSLVDLPDGPRELFPPLTKAGRPKHVRDGKLKDTPKKRRVAVPVSRERL